MTDAHDDPWASLAENLGIDEPATPAAPAPAPARGGRRRKADAVEGEVAPSRGRRRSTKPEPVAEVEPEPEVVGEVESDVAEDEDGEEGPPIAGEETGPDGQPKKRRRRRSRRKKGSPGAPEGDVAPIPTAIAAPVESDDDEFEDAPVARPMLASEGEDADVTPVEIYTNWNMPSWQELIDGLHKP